MTGFAAEQPDAVDPVLADLLHRIQRSPARLGPWLDGQSPSTRLVLIDGPAGSGKTTLSADLSALLGGAPVVHMDDLYPGWSGLLAGIDRLDAEILTPLAAGRSAAYRRYDWDLARLAESHDVPPAPVLIVEGCGCGARRFAALTTLLIWVEADDDERLARGLARDGLQSRPHWLRWMTAERELYRTAGTDVRADVRLDGHRRVLP